MACFKRDVLSFHASGKQHGQSQGTMNAGSLLLVEEGNRPVCEQVIPSHLNVSCCMGESFLVWQLIACPGGDSQRSPDVRRRPVASSARRTNGAGEIRNRRPKNLSNTDAFFRTE